jgi:hypothetical protein
MSRLLQRLVAIGLLLASLAFVAFAVLWPVGQGWLDNHAAIQVARERLVHLPARRSDPASLAERRRALEAVSDAQAGLLPGATDPEATSRLEAHIRSLAQGAGAENVSLRPAPPAEEEGVRALRTNLVVTLADDRLVTFLSQLETAAPAVFLESIRIRGLEAMQAGGQGLRVELTGLARAYLSRPPAGGPRS